MAGGITRRALLCSSAVGMLQACGGKYTTCYDPEMLGPGETEMRETLEYVSVSDDDSLTCEGCQFYYLGGEECGECRLLDGPVASAGYCTSWARKF